MIYQLPNGKVIHITVEEYLDLTDQDIQYLISINAGNHVHSPWHGSVVKKGVIQEDAEDSSIDYTPESDEPFTGHGIEEPIEEDFPDVTEESE